MSELQHQMDHHSIVEVHVDVVIQLHVDVREFVLEVLRILRDHLGLLVRVLGIPTEDRILEECKMKKEISRACLLHLTHKARIA